jgi:hypothetical protein
MMKKPHQHAKPDLKPANASNPGEKFVAPNEQNKPETDTTRHFVGLCAHCELRETCERPGIQGGIWSCNDYR